MLNQTKEFFSFVAAVVSGTVKSLANGKFGFEDITNYIQAFLTGQDGIEGAGEIPSELIAADPEAKRELFADLEASLASSGMTDADAYDTAEILSGAGSGIAIGSRLTSKKKNEQVAQLLRNGTLIFNGAVSYEADDWGADDVQNMLNEFAA